MKLAALPAATPAPTPTEPRPSLRAYQQNGAQFLSTRKRALLADDPGLGKTLQALAAIEQLNPTPRTVLIVAPKIAFGTWKYEIERWFGITPAIFPHDEITSAAFRSDPPFHEMRQVPAFTITNYEQLSRLIRVRKSWGAIIVDESHMIRNHKTLRFKTLKQFSSKALFLLSGSPIVNYPDDLWSTLNLLDSRPPLHHSYWRFAETFCAIETNEFAGTRRVTGLRPVIMQNGRSADLTTEPTARALRVHLTPFMLRRQKSEVLAELPPKIRQPIYAELKPAQREIYESLSEELIVELSTGDFVIAPNALTKLTRLRQTLISPALYGGPNESGALEALCESAALDFDAGNPIIIFTPFAKAVRLITEALHAKADMHPRIWAFTGDTPQNKREQAISEFQNSKWDSRALICTIGVATSFTATAAQTAYFLGYDFTPASNTQAEDRIHRIGSHYDSIHAKYIITPGTIDDHILSIIEGKSQWADLILNPRALLRGNAFLPRNRSAAP